MIYIEILVVGVLPEEQKDPNPLSEQETSELRNLGNCRHKVSDVHVLHKKRHKITILMMKHHDSTYLTNVAVINQITNNHTRTIGSA
jgi:hypothetical protein